MAKRALDLILALLAAFAFLPVMLVVAALIRWHMGSPVLFRQLRPGLHAIPFELMKFRTMHESFDRNGNPLPDAARLSGLGNILRRYSLDELPQLFNVVRGEMSLVGPRPLLMEYLPLYSQQQARRHDVRPGVTGWAQVNGRNAISWDEKFDLDVWYVDHQSLLLDLRILAMTVMKVFRGGDVNQPGEATMTRFTGAKGEVAGDG
jgi:lipopolysaccharide/colanic/teichoic acid biosynthesis glycosyltransferase